MDLSQHIARVPDFPEPGILFYDISPLLAHPTAWQETVRRLETAVAPYEPTVLAGIESRGFLVAAPLALQLGLGFVMLRKPGKLPGPTVKHTYALEYGQDAIEIQEGAVGTGQRVVILDDLLATGGTMQASAELLRKRGAEVPAAACIIELAFLSGRAKVGVPVHSLMAFDSEGALAASA